MKGFFIGVLVGSLGTYSINDAFFASDNHADVQQEETHYLHDEVVDIHSGRELSAEQVAEVSAQNNLLKAQLAKLEANHSSASTINDIPSQPACDYSLISEMSAIGQLNSQSPEQLLNISEEGFANETIDGHWAEIYESSLQKMFRETESIADYIPEQIECREKSCKVSIPVSDPLTQTKVAEELLNSIAGNSHGIYGKASVFLDKDGNKLKLFLMRKLH